MRQNVLSFSDIDTSSGSGNLALFGRNYRWFGVNVLVRRRQISNMTKKKFSILNLAQMDEKVV